MIIRESIRDWCYLEHVQHDRNSTVVITPLDAAARAHNVDEDQYTTVLRSWRGYIEGKLDPQREMNLPWGARCAVSATWERRPGMPAPARHPVPG